MIQLWNFYQLSFPETFNPFKDFQSDQIQRSSRKIFIPHFACRNADLILTPVTGTTNEFIFSNNQFINRIFWGKLELACCKHWIFYILLFYLQCQLIQTDAPTTGAATISGLNFLCLFQSAEIQVPENKYGCPQRLSFSAGNLFWDSHRKLFYLS